MYVDPETMPVEAYFPAKKTFIENYNKMSTPRPVSKHCLGFIFIQSYYHQLDMNFDETKLISKSYHTSNIKVQLFCKNNVVIKEE